MQDGITTEFEIQDRMWCCKTTEDQCIGDDPDYPSKITCNGTALSLSDQSHDENYDGLSCNYHPLDEKRNYNGIFRSYLDMCQDNRYVQHNKAEFFKEICYKSLFSL